MIHGYTLLTRALCLEQSTTSGLDYDETLTKLSIAGPKAEGIPIYTVANDVGAQRASRFRCSGLLRPEKT